MPDLLLLWDIDGTLLENPSKGHSHQNEFASAISKLVDRELKSPDKIDGSTDYAIIHGILKNSGLSQVEANRLYPLILGELERITTDPDLIKKSRRPLKGARETLASLSNQAVQTYATGNSPARAEAKLAQFQMNHFLDLEIGGFGWWTGKRSDFVQRAIDLAQDKHQKEFRVVVIGDTPFDVESAHEVGATSVAVAGGVFSVKDLKASNPHLILNDLSGDHLKSFLLSF